MPGPDYKPKLPSPSESVNQFFSQPSDPLEPFGCPSCRCEPCQCNHEVQVVPDRSLGPMILAEVHKAELLKVTLERDAAQEKAAMFDRIQAVLWAMATSGNVLQSLLAASLIRQLAITSPDGDEPEQA